MNPRDGVCGPFLNLLHRGQVPRSIFDALSDDEKQDIIDYKNGKLTRQWMYNPTNLKFIVDNNLMD